MSPLLRLAVVVPILAAGVGPSRAQIAPATSGKQSFGEPEMRRHGGGLYRSHKPHHHRRRFTRTMR